MCEQNLKLTKKIKAKNICQGYQRENIGLIR